MRSKFLSKVLNWRTGLGGVVAAALVGVFLTVSSSAVMEWTNTEGFCISCHEMRVNVYEEYRETIHFNNRSGVRAVCSDCHVPRAMIPKLIRKFQATGELWAKATGKLDTPEKFEAHRYELALRVWTTMKKNDSLECRNCHDHASMSSKHQTEKAWDRHEKAIREKMTCIDCHFAIAHREPEGDLGPQDIVIKK